jgi:hypothetical protein
MCRAGAYRATTTNPDGVRVAPTSTDTACSKLMRLNDDDRPHTEAGDVIQDGGEVTL